MRATRTCLLLLLFTWRASTKSCPTDQFFDASECQKLVQSIPSPITAVVGAGGRTLLSGDLGRLPYTWLSCLSVCSFSPSAFVSPVIIKDVTLIVHPATEVERDTNLTLTCRAKVSHTGGHLPQYTYNFYKNHKTTEVNTQRTDAVEQVTFSIPDARVSDSGSYQCEVVIGENTKKSNQQKINVKGLQVPELIVDKLEVREGEAVSATCRAEKEKGSLTFSFKDGSEELFFREAIGHAQTTFTLPAGKVARLSCSYLINVASNVQVQSNDSNVVSVTVQVLDIVPNITFRPATEVIEGDNVSISCSVGPASQNLPTLSLQLTKGNKILKTNMTTSSYSSVVKAEDAGDYECNAIMNNVAKITKAKLNVKELFSRPVLTIQPSEAFERQTFEVSCRSTEFAQERIRQADVKYSIYRNGIILTPGAFDGTYRATASTHTNGNYTCNAQAKMIIKVSQPRIYTAKVLVSRPLIEVVKQVVLSRPFQIRCHSENGSFPITYTLIRNDKTLNRSLATDPHVQPTFFAIINSEREIHEFRCEAQNSQHVPPLRSEALSAPVIVPVGKPLLTVLPTPGEVTEGENVTLICSISRGTPPVSFIWYHVDRLLKSNTVSANFSTHTLQTVSSENSGSYYCEAVNNGNERDQSNRVTFTVRMARWKKGLIVGSCLLFLAVTLMALVLLIRYRSKRGKRETAAQLSVDDVMWYTGKKSGPELG
ncbi:hypothetical protein NFI96_014534 [Prochilodus magdalenae]|nr:hypothetical protein NFI96_014534 [Prochilodus magdalenae]